MAQNPPIQGTNERLKNMILAYARQGKSVSEACRDFSRESNSAYFLNCLRWYLFIRGSIRGDYDEAVEDYYRRLLERHHNDDQAREDRRNVQAERMASEVGDTTDAAMDTNGEGDQFMSDSQDMNEKNGRNDGHEPNGADEQETAKNMMNIAHKDKISLDLLLAVEHIIKDREISKLSLSDMQEKLNHGQETIEKLKQERAQLEQKMSEKDGEILNLEQKLTSKQMSYEQLLEDYRQLQVTSASEIEDVQYKLEMAQNKYAKLTKEFNEARMSAMREVEKLEERIRDLRVENEKVNAQYQSVLQEKAKLLHTIHDFTDNLSSSFSQLQEEEAPPRPNVISLKNDK